MSYLPELDDGPKEVRRGYAGNVLRFWPHVPGIGNVQLAAAPTFKVFNPSGTQIGGDAVSTITDLGAPLVSRVNLAIDASDTDAWELGDHYRVEVTWVYQGEETQSTVHFSCSREPYTPNLSLNDFVEEAADAAQYLEAQAQVLDAARTAEEHASVLAVKAWSDVYGWLQNRLFSEGERIVPRCVIPKWKLNRVVIAQALHRMYRAEGGAIDTPSSDLTLEWKDEAATRFDALGALDYDADEDGTVDQEVTGPVSRKMRRSWF
jgi:hypothetical protein